MVLHTTLWKSHFCGWKSIINFPRTHLVFPLSSSSNNVLLSDMNKLCTRGEGSISFPQHVTVLLFMPCSQHYFSLSFSLSTQLLQHMFPSFFNNLTFFSFSIFFGADATSNIYTLYCHDIINGTTIFVAIHSPPPRSQ